MDGQRVEILCKYKSMSRYQLNNYNQLMEANNEAAHRNDQCDDAARRAKFKTITITGKKVYPT